MDNFIEVYQNVFDHKYCDAIVEWFNYAEDSGMTLNRQEHDKAPKTAKEDESTFIPSFPMRHAPIALMEEFNNVFWGTCYKEYAAKYSILDDCGPHTTYTIKIQKTKPGQGYHTWHCESASKEFSHRLLAWTAYMNDDFEAGETEFLYQQYRYKPSKGDCIIFPAAYTHTHRGNPPIGGDKYIITGWVEF